MSNEQLNLTIDTEKLNITTPEDFVIYLDKEIDTRFNKVCLKSMHVRINARVKLNKNCFYVHCSILNQDDNLVNGKKSDIIAVPVASLKPNRVVSFKLGNISSRLIKKHSSSIRMYITDAADNVMKLVSNFSIVYELEFS